MVSLKVKLHGEEFEVELPPDQTILETLIDEGYDPPHSCTAGSCSTCMAKLYEGKVEMDRCLALDDDEIEAGYILTCQSRPKTDVIRIEYED